MAVRRAGPHRVPDAVLRAALRLGGPTVRIRAARALVRRGHPLPDGLDDPVPGVRRIAARGLGWAGEAAFATRLRDALGDEPTDTVRAAIAGAALRCGVPRDEVLGVVRARANRVLLTPSGPRRPTLVTVAAAHDAEKAVDIEAPGPRDAFVRAHLLAGPDDDALFALAAQVPDGLVLSGDAGRRGHHRLIEARGWLGDPRARASLEAVLAATDRDPGRGFAERRLAAVALGRLGDPSARPAIEAALRRETDFDGPGAGLGIQYPVRNLLIWALGELGDATAAPTLVGYLGDVTSTATGGLSLPAMGALVKLGAAVIPFVAVALDGADDAAIAAAGVLAALGPSDALERARRDPRAAVRGAAAAPFELGPALARFAEQAWFVAHEELEVGWRAATGEEKELLHALLHGAVAYEHLHRGNRRAAWSQWTKALARLDRLPPTCGGIDLRAWRRAVDGFLASIGLPDADAGSVPAESTWPIPSFDRPTG